MRNSIPAWAIVVSLIATAPGCHALISKKEDKAPVKVAKVTGRIVQNGVTGGLAETYYAARGWRPWFGFKFNGD